MWNIFCLGFSGNQPWQMETARSSAMLWGNRMPDIGKFFSSKLSQSSVPFHLFISGYTSSLFPFANESCVSRFITSRIKNAGFLISDI